jgi:hypothetical protein
MMLRPLSRAFAVALTLSAGTASAQTMDFGCPKPGTTFVFDSGTSLTARGIEGMDCTMQKADGPAVKVRALLFDNPGADGKDTSAFIAAIRPERLWPLQVGKKIEASYSAGGQTWSYVLSVARFEKKMGPDNAQFDAFVIEMNEQGDKGYRSISRWWVSSAEKYVLQYDFSNSDSRSNRAIVTSIRR